MEFKQVVASSRTFKFPKLGMEENPLKLDIMQTVASAYLCVKPGCADLLCNQSEVGHLRKRARARVRESERKRERERERETERDIYIYICI